MYVRATSTRLPRGRSTPAMRAILYPCLCLCFWLEQMTRTTPSRRTTLHFTQIFRTDDRTFTMSSPSPGGNSNCNAGTLSCSRTLSYYPATAGVVGGQLDHHPVPRPHPQEGSLGADVRGDLGSLLRLQLQPVQRVRQLLDHPCGHRERFAAHGRCST